MSAPAIDVQGLTRRFGAVTAVDDLSFTVNGPGVFGFLGANGAGKTTCIRMLVGLIHPTKGAIRLLGSPADETGPALRARLGYLPQDPAFYSWMSGEEHLLHVGDLFGLSRKESGLRAAELLELCGISDAARRKVGGYSGGMKQRLGIAQALIGRPELILLDEPVSALDPVGRAEVLELIDTLGREATVFMSSHILADVERVCEKVAIIDQGRLLVHERTSSLRARALRPILTCTLRGDVSSLSSRLKETAWIADLEVEPVDDEPNTSMLRVHVTDLAEAESGIPRLVADAGLRLASMSPALPSLEEVFIALVGKKASGPKEDSR